MRRSRSFRSFRANQRFHREFVPANPSQNLPVGNLSSSSINFSQEPVSFFSRVFIYDNNIEKLYSSESE